MNIKITTFTNPFSFFCTAENEYVLAQNNLEPAQDVFKERIYSSNVDHGQNHINSRSNLVSFAKKFDDEECGEDCPFGDKWVRGIVTMEDQFLIWLVDYGIYLHPTEKTVYTKLPLDYKNYPTKVFEASVHGVVPMDKALNEQCQIENIITNKWSKGAIDKALELIASALKIYFMPVALLSHKDNDIVIGDVYLQLKNMKIVNMVDELELWPVFLEKNKDVYIKNLSTYYTTRRRHRACLLKPVFPDVDLPVLSLLTTLKQYSDICRNTQQHNIESEHDSASEYGSTVLDADGCYMKYEKPYKLTAEEIEKYSTMVIKVHDREYNVLQVLLNKVNDLNICEKYKDLKSVGRATTRMSSSF